MKNRTIAHMFDRLADILEFQGEISFKVNAYRKAARAIKNLGRDIEIDWTEKTLNAIPGIGEALAKKIDEFLSTGRMSKYDELVQGVPPDLLDLLTIQNIGPKTLATAHHRLGVRNREDLKNAIQDGSLARLPGMGAKKVVNILKGIEIQKKSAGRIPLGIALPTADRIIHRIRSHPHVNRIHYAGSLRRMQETVGDIDILAETDRGEEVIRTFTELPEVERILAAGGTRGSVVTKENIQVDIRTVERDSYGAALQYFTGSQAHNIRLRSLAKERGYRINEYGIYKGGKKVDGGKEEDIYETLNMTCPPPELREDRGEIEAAAGDALPELIDLVDINGDLHVHTEWSDGHTTIQEMADKAASLGYAYIAICDHSQSADYAGGLTPDRLLEQMHEIQNLNATLSNIRILAGAEVDIRSDGSLDFPDELLKQLDFVVASIHSGFKTRVTERLVSAAKNPHVAVIGHPTGRLIGQREGYDVDLDPVMKACAETGTALEINAYFERLDLNDIHARRARDMGVTLAINTDAHHPSDMNAMRLGLGVARRAWLEKGDVLNCFPIEKLRIRRGAP